MERNKEMIKVWDPVVRIGHWTLVVAFFTAYFTEDDFLTQHVWAGYTVGVVVCLRLVWGFVGSKHARFTDFVRSPVFTKHYIGDLLGQRSKRYIGHNPAGGAMVVCLMLGLVGTTASGLMLYAIEENAGPLSGWVQDDSSLAGSSLSMQQSKVDDHKRSRHSDDDEESGRAEFWEDIHEVFANLTLLLVGLHIAGVLFSSYQHRENLIRSMFTGRKRKE